MSKAKADLAYEEVVRRIYAHSSFSLMAQEFFSIKEEPFLEKIPSEIALLTQVNSLSLSGLTRLKELPEELADLEGIYRMFMSGAKFIPKGVALLENITALYFNENFFLKSTKWNELAQLPKLVKLSLVNSLNNFDILPLPICRLTNLKALDISYNSLKELPNEFADLSQLENLNLKDNQFETVPKLLFELPNLKQLYICDGMLEQGDYSILGLQKIPKLFITTKNTKNKVRVNQIKKLLHHSVQYGYDRSFQELLLDVICAKKVIRDLSNKDLLAILNCRLAVFTNQALDELSARIKKDQFGVFQLPTKGAKIIIKGKIAGKVSELKARLEQIGTTVGKKSEEGANNYILIGALPKETNTFLSTENQLITEKILVKHLDDLEQPYLLEKDVDQATFANIQSLLHSKDAVNIQLALEVIKAGGYPAELREELFWAYKRTKNAKLKKEIQRVIGPHESADFMEVLKSRKGLQSFFTEKTINSNLLFFCEKAKLDKNKMVNLVLENYGKGILFALWELPTKDKIKFVKKYMQDFTNRHQAGGAISQIRYGTLILWDLGLTRLPNDFDQLEDIKILNLSGNKFQEMPLVLTKCKDLEEIYIYHMPQLHNTKIWQIPNLKVAHYAFMKKEKRP